jgi:hypothetical protein
MNEELCISYDEELRDLYRSLYTITTEKSRRLRWAGYVARMERQEIRTEFWVKSWKTIIKRVRKRQEDCIKVDFREI